MYYVYVYCDPTVLGRWGSLTHEPFYVGEGKGHRIKAHFTCSRNPDKTARIEKCRAAGAEPLVLKVAEGLTKEESRALEAQLIAEFGTVKVIAGIPRGPLTNKNRGGGGVATHSEKTKERMRATRTGMKHAPETIAKIAATKQKGLRPETIAALSKARGNGKWMTDGVIQKFVQLENIDALLRQGFRLGAKPRNNNLPTL